MNLIYLICSEILVFSIIALLCFFKIVRSKVEFVKKHWDGLNSKLIPVMDVAVGIILSVITNAGKVVIGTDGSPVLHPVVSIYTLVVGIACGIAAAASYSVAMNVTANVGGTSTPPGLCEPDTVIETISKKEIE